MLSLDHIKFDISSYGKYKEVVNKYAGFNPACDLHKIWQDAGQGGFEYLASQGGKFSSVDWVGSGYPARKQIYDFVDELKLEQFFVEPDSPDVNETLYQWYFIREYTRQFVDNLNVLDIGGGYGRFSMALWAMRQALNVTHLDDKVYSYTTVDYTPLSLWGAPQFAQQAMGVTTMDCLGDVVRGNDGIGLNFYSVGAWTFFLYNSKVKYDLIVNTHSMQEMTPETFAFYLDFIETHLDERGVFYFVNQKPTWGKSLSDYALERGKLRVIEAHTFDRLGQETYEVVLQVKE